MKKTNVKSGVLKKSQKQTTETVWGQRGQVKLFKVNEN